MAIETQEQADATYAEIVGPLNDRERAVVSLIHRYAGDDGAHHKMWVIDQALRTLLGEDNYTKFIEVQKFGADGPETYGWDEGIAP